MAAHFRAIAGCGLGLAGVGFYHYQGAPTRCWTKMTAEALGRRLAGFSTKAHVCCDALGNSRRMLLTTGKSSDYLQAEALLGIDKPGAVVADKGYDGVGFARMIEGAEVVIYSRSNQSNYGSLTGTSIRTEIRSKDSLTELNASHGSNQI